MPTLPPGKTGPTLDNPPRSIRPGLVPRTIYFPPNVLARIETRPGALIELLTVLLSEHLQKGGQQ